MTAIAISLLGGCRRSYHLEGQGRMAILLPPVPPAVSKDPPSVFLIKAPNARRLPATLDGCDIQNSLLTLQWFGNSAEIRLKPESYFPAPGDQNPEEVAPRVYLDSMHKVEEFRDALEDRVVRGCLRSKEAQSLTRTIAERLPLPPLVGHYIRFGGGATGTVDLTPDFRLNVVSPIRGAGSIREVVDYQTTSYRLTAAPNDARMKISLESTTPGHPQKMLAPARAPIEFPDSFQFYRLFFRTANSSTDHLATILGAPEESALNTAAARLKMEQNPSCEALSLPGVFCLTPPAEVALNLEFPVSVNRKQVFVPLGGTLADALQPRKPTAPIAPTLRIRRLFHGRLRPVKFAPASQDVLRFVLMPGDEITW